MFLLFLMLVIDLRGRTFDDFSIDDVLIYLSFFFLIAKGEEV